MVVLKICVNSIDHSKEENIMTIEFDINTALDVRIKN